MEVQIAFLKGLILGTNTSPRAPAPEVELPLREPSGEVNPAQPSGTGPKITRLINNTGTKIEWTGMDEQEELSDESP